MRYSLCELTRNLRQAEGPGADYTPVARLLGPQVEQGGGVGHAAALRRAGSAALDDAGDLEPLQDPVGQSGRNIRSLRQNVNPPVPAGVEQQRLSDDARLARQAGGSGTRCGEPVSYTHLRAHETDS